MSASSAESVEPNLTPILDLVFQLITFFMLVTNFKGASVDLSLKLPVLGSAQPLEWKGRQEPLMLNVNTQGKVLTYGQTVEIEPFIAKEARLLKTLLQGTDAINEDGTFKVPVVIRADKDVTFAKLNHIIRTCQNSGYREFSLSAMNRREGE